MLLVTNIDPIAVKIGPFPVHWYGVMYLIGFLGAWWLGRLRAARPGSCFTVLQIGDVIFYGAMGVMLGGRIGYMLIYDLTNFLHEPALVFKIWQGGMSFHGGLLGVCAAMWLYARQNNKGFFLVTDFIAPLVPVGLCAGRIGNFINGELWGKPTVLPWGMVFPAGGNIPRHPSMLYEAILEGPVLFVLLWLYSSRPRPARSVSALFLIGYGSFRFLIEFIRLPDAQLGYLAFNWLTMGQALSVLMILAGAGLLANSARHSWLRTAGLI